MGQRPFIINSKFGISSIYLIRGAFLILCHDFPNRNNKCVRNTFLELLPIAGALKPSQKYKPMMFKYLKLRYNEKGS